MNPKILLGIALMAWLQIGGGCSQPSVQHSEVSAPKRYAWVTGLDPKKADYYRELHANPWPTVLSTLKSCNIQNFSIYLCEIEGRLYLFSYLEYTGDDWQADMAKMASDPETQKWWKETDSCQLPLPDAAKAGKIWSDAEEVFHLP